jgi:hypothetical protein
VIGNEELTGDNNDDDCDVLDEDVLEEAVFERLDFFLGGSWPSTRSPRVDGGGIKPGCCDMYW